MTDDQQASATVFDAVSEMEADILNVQSWGVVFQLIASSADIIEPEAVRVIARALSELGTRLEGKYRAAERIAQGREMGQPRHP